MSRFLDDALGWVETGTVLVRDALAGLDEDGFAGPSALPGWTRKHVLAHLAANAEAIGNLVHWAATGERTPMYTSPEQRNADIESGSQRSGAELTSWFDESAGRLAASMARLTGEQWAAEVLTAQGRSVPASETPWMRAREVMVHAVDLDTGVTFAELPAPFLGALGDDVVAKRSGAGTGPALKVLATDHAVSWTVDGAGDQLTVSGSIADVVAWLAGREAPVTTEAGTPAPLLPAWL